MMFKAREDFVFAERMKAEERVTPGGIVIPGDASSAPDTAKVLSVGEHVDGVKVGDVILIGRFSGTEVFDGQDKFVVIQSRDIMGVRSSAS